MIALICVITLMSVITMMVMPDRMKERMNRMRELLLMVVLCIMLPDVLSAQEQSQDDHAAASAQANNPLANMTALNFQNYYMPVLSGAPSESYMNTAWIRFAKPFANGKFLLRASVPLSTIGSPAGGVVTTTSGLSDINAFVSYALVSKPTATVGIGPMVTMPTASETSLGTGKWQGGFAFVAFLVKSPVLQLGGLITWQASFAGDKNRASTNFMAVQPFYFWQLGGGTYLRGAPIWAFDMENKSYSVPLALGIGQVVKMGTTVFNLFVEPQYAILVHGVQPQVQIFTGINLQFMKKP